MLFKHPHFIILDVWNFNRQYLKAADRTCPTAKEAFWASGWPSRLFIITGLMVMQSRNSEKQQVLLWKVKHTQGGK